jgi:hypothetical protein
MGYLKRRRSRMRDLQSAQDAFPEEVDHDALAWAFAREWTQATRELDRSSFVRFAVHQRGVPKAAYQGIFQTAYAVARQRVPDGDVERADLAAHVRELLDWFEEHLRPHDPRRRRAVFWFRASATECIDRVWELRRLLERAGYTVSVLETTSPGHIVFQDELQIVALRPVEP